MSSDVHISLDIHNDTHNIYIYRERDACIIECMCIWLCVVDMVAWQALDGIINLFHTNVSV